MSHFLIRALDHPGTAARERRAALRAEHMRLLNTLHAEGFIVDAGAILDEQGSMAGSLIICRADDLARVHAYLAEEPFAREAVWQEVDVRPYRPVQWTTPAAPASTGHSFP